MPPGAGSRHAVPAAALGDIRGSGPHIVGWTGCVRTKGCHSSFPRQGPAPSFSDGFTEGQVATQHGSLTVGVERPAGGPHREGRPRVLPGERRATDLSPNRRTPGRRAAALGAGPGPKGRAVGPPGTSAEAGTFFTVARSGISTGPKGPALRMPAGPANPSRFNGAAAGPAFEHCARTSRPGSVVPRRCRAVGGSVRGTARRGVGSPGRSGCRRVVARKVGCPRTRAGWNARWWIRWGRRYRRRLPFSTRQGGTWWKAVPTPTDCSPLPCRPAPTSCP